MKKFNRILNHRNNSCDFMGEKLSVQKKVCADNDRRNMIVVVHNYVNINSSEQLNKIRKYNAEKLCPK